MKMDTREDDIEIVVNAIDRVKAQLNPIDRCHAEKHDYRVFAVTLGALRRRRGDLNYKARFAYQVARKDLRRRINRDRTRYLNSECVLDENLVANQRSRCPITSTDPVVEACRREQAEQVDTALRRLPANQENVLRSLHFDTSAGQNLARLAARLGVTRQTISRWRDQGYATLGQRLRRT